MSVDRGWGGAACVALVAVVQAQVVCADTFKYQRPDGTWVFTDNPDAVPEQAKRLSGKDKRKKRKTDLAAALLASQKPKNAIERARLAVVLVKSAIGHGSGFFISHDGYLISNLHVLELPKRERKRQRKIVRNVSGRFEKVRKQLIREQQQLDAKTKELERYGSRLSRNAYTKRRNALVEWQQNLRERWVKYTTSLEQFKEVERKSEHRSRVARLATDVDIELANRTALRAYRVAVNEKWDVALLKVDGYRTPALEAASADDVAVGDEVFAIGNPISLRQSVAKGVFSGRERGYVKTDAKIYPGNSGGPLVTADGNVLGINTFKQLTHKFEGLGFAVPIERATRIFSDYLSVTSNETKRRAKGSSELEGPPSPGPATSR